MADPSRDTDTNGHAETRRIPRWVWISGIAIALVGLTVIAILLVGGGHDGGPWRHGSNGDDPPPSSATEGHVPPADGHQ